ncbi:MAG TPA: PEP-CTERM sorting domain-containing protein [Acetobacteraceae bacterium]
MTAPAQSTKTGEKTLQATLAAAAVAVICLAAPASAGPVIINGGFEVLSPSVTGSTEFGARYAGQVVTGWTTTGYNYVFTPGTADTSGAANEYNQHLKLWGPGDGSSNGLTAASPAGGNFLGADGPYYPGPIQQAVTGLDVGSVATISFYWAGAQQYGYDGPTTEAWQVSLGNETHVTPVLRNANHGFTGWQQQTLSFVVTSATEVLSFLAIGTPAGVPPFALLDGVTVSEVPEPSSLVLLGMGLGAAGLACRCCRAR